MNTTIANLGQAIDNTTIVSLPNLGRKPMAFTYLTPAWSARADGRAIRTPVIDFDRVLRDPANPSRMRPEYSSGDGVHPNDTGYRAMADAIPLFLFRERETD